MPPAAIEVLPPEPPRILPRPLRRGQGRGASFDIVARVLADVLSRRLPRR